MQSTIISASFFEFHCKFWGILAFMVLFTFPLSASDGDILELHQKKFQWMINQQMDSLDQLLSEDVLYIHSNGWVEDKSEVLENIASGYLGYHKVKILEQAVRHFESTAVVTGKARFDVSLDGRPISLDLLYSETYFQANGKWLLVHRHSCQPTVKE